MNGWILAYDGFDAAREGLREALCTLGNGYFATRGAAAEASADGTHYPGTYLAGGYNRLRTQIAERSVENEDLVNLPNWLVLGFRIGGQWFAPQSVELLEYRQELDLRRGILERNVRWRDDAGRVSRLRERRLVHMSLRHHGALEATLTAENWSGDVQVRSALDGNVRNAGVARYRDLDGRHLEPIAAESFATDSIFLQARTRQSRLEIALAARTHLYRGDERLEPVADVLREDGYVAQRFTVPLAQGESLRVEKVVALFSSRDRAISESGLDAREALGPVPGFAELAASQARTWEHLWQRFDITVRERAGSVNHGHDTQLVLRLHIFHLLQTASINSIDLDTGVPARGWHGEAYRGHIFWDELFIFPLLNLRLPEITRALLLYRYRRLPEARANARAAGFGGAMYPWQSGSSGREESQRFHLNPASGRWIPDHTYLQRHVNAAIAYNIWLYVQVTHDLEFLAFYGAEMFLEIARFWASATSFNAELGRYEITGVVGPDEFHTAYPGAERPGLDNHGYTNLMAVWVLRRARDVLARLPAQRCHELRAQLELADEELAHWDDVSRRMRLVFHDGGVLSQFQGYDALAELDWEHYRRKYADIHRLDRILEAEGDSINRYKASKQADVLMLFYLFSSEELRDLFERLGYPFEHETIPRNVAYYGPRTSHGSTLSRLVDSWVLARSDRTGSWRVFKEALESDVSDAQDGTTPEGIHLGAMAGVVDLLQRGYTGIVTGGDALRLDPSLPEELECLQMVLRYRGHGLELRFSHDEVEVYARPSDAAPIRIVLSGHACEIAPGQRRRFTPKERWSEVVQPR